MRQILVQGCVMGVMDCRVRDRAALVSVSTPRCGRSGRRRVCPGRSPDANRFHFNPAVGDTNPRAVRAHYKRLPIATIHAPVAVARNTKNAAAMAVAGGFRPVLLRSR